MSNNKLATDEIDAGVWGAAGSVVTTEGEHVAPIVATIAGHAPNTATTQATQAAITTCANLVTVGTIGTGVWRGTAVASAYLDDDTAHLTTDQTFSGKKTFSAPITASGNISASGGIIGSNTIKLANTKEFQGGSTQTGATTDSWYHSNNEAENAADKYADDTSLTGAIVDGVSVLTPQQCLIGGKYIVPTATTCSVWRGAITNVNGKNAAVCLVKATPVDNSNTNLAVTVIASASIAGTGNLKPRLFNATLQNTYLDAGDIIIPLVNRYDTSGGQLHFNTTLLFYTNN